MNSITTVRALVRAVQESFSEFEVRGRLLFARPLHYLVRGIYFDSSAFSKNSFYPQVFIQPLYMEKDHMFFTFGGRLQEPKGEGWILRENNADVILLKLVDALRSKGVPFLESIQEPIDLALACEKRSLELAEEFDWVREDINVMEAAAYSWFLAGNTRRSLEILEKIHGEVVNGNDSIDWVKALDERTQFLRKILEEGDEYRAHDLLKDWTQKSAAALGISDYLEIPKTKL